MAAYALLHVLHGDCNSFGLSEITFRRPLKTDRERELHTRAIETITQRAFQLSFYWGLVDEPVFDRFMSACREISGADSEKVILPRMIKHGLIDFSVCVRFEGYTLGQKDLLVQKIVETGIDPSDQAIDAYFHIDKKETERWGSAVIERLEVEQRAAFARNLEFLSE